jgi:uncharacterized protein (TIGR02266 family)
MTTDGPLRVRLRYADLETFMAKFAPNVSRGGLFIASRQPRSVGEIFRFEIMLAGGETMLSGDGKVTWVKEFNPEEPTKPHGMGVQFVRLDPECRPTLERILRLKGQGAASRGKGRVSPTPTSMAAQAPGDEAPGGRGDDGQRVMPVIPAARPGTEKELQADGDIDSLVKELGLDDATLRRALDRARGAGARWEDLAAAETAEPDGGGVTLAQALAELPRLVAKSGEPGTTRRPRTGQIRPAEMASTTPPPAAEPTPPLDKDDRRDPERPAVVMSSRAVREPDEIGADVFAAVDRLQKV